jgi:outer membrane lipoprotein-sorting protein
MYLIIITIFSCAPVPKKISPPLPVDKIFQRLLENYKSLETFEASGTISVDSKRFKNSGDFKLAIKKPDSLLINITGPFGINFATASVVKNRLIYLNELTNQVLYAAATQENIRELLRVDISFEELIDILTGGIVINPEGAENQSAKVEEDQYVITLQRNEYLYKYWIDIRNLSVSKNLIQDKAGNLLIDLQFGDFIEKEGVVIPRSINFTNSIRSEKIKVNYINVSVNKRNLDLRIYVPDDAEVIEW